MENYQLLYGLYHSFVWRVLSEIKKHILQGHHQRTYCSTLNFNLHSKLCALRTLAQAYYRLVMMMMTGMRMSASLSKLSRDMCSKPRSGVSKYWNTFILSCLHIIVTVCGCDRLKKSGPLCSSLISLKPQIALTVVYLRLETLLQRAMYCL